ncbi:TetR family transcriptional regulator [Mycobacterium sp. Root135]|nr:TetR family transcriptional regulator [Mycobacterium sp. Root135]
MAKSSRSTYHHGDLKRALIEAALTLVAEKGPRGFTLTEAARRAGVSPAAPYRHFPDKAHLLAAVAEQGFVELHEALVAVGSGVPDARARVNAMARGYVRWAVAHPEYYQVMFGGDTNKSEHPGLLEAGGRTFGCLLEVITECLSSGLIQGDDPLRIAGPMWSTIHGTATLAIGGDLGQVGIDEQPEDLVQRSANVLLAGLALGVD